MTSLSLMQIRPSANAHLAALVSYNRNVIVVSRHRLGSRQQIRARNSIKPATSCMSLSGQGPLGPQTSKTSLNKCTKAQLVSHAQQMHVDDSGTKPALVQRLMSALSTAQPLAQTAEKEGELQKLQAEVAELDSKLVVVTHSLAEASAAREHERQQLTDVIAEMATMRERWQTDVHQVEELGLLAGSLEQSERDILNLRSQQSRFEERVAMIQGLLQEREQEVVTLKAQLSEFHQPALAMAGSGTTVTSWETETAVVTEPIRTAAFSGASWVDDWNAVAVRKRDSNGTVLQPVPELPSALQSATAPKARSITNREHTAPGLAIIAAVGAAAQRGGAAWDSVKRLLPQDKRIMADAALAAGATALLHALYS